MNIPELRSVIEPTLLEILRTVDAEEAERVRQCPCPHCGGRLHRADYPRSPRGVPEVADEDCLRFSFCCAECRRRTTPKSVRFLGRKVYFGPVVVVACTLRALGELARRVSGRYGAALITVRRWTVWWRGPAAESGWWRWARGLVMPPIDETKLIASLCERFCAVAGELRKGLVRVLGFVAPLTVPSEYPVVN